MNLYRTKMHIKRIPLVNRLVELKKKKSDRLKGIALRTNGLRYISELEIILKNSRFQFFADYGTLLGAIRDHDFIAWDNDLDYGLLINNNEDWEEFRQIMERNGFSRIRQFSNNGLITEQTYRKGDLTIDFFAHIKCPTYDIVYTYFRKDKYIYSSFDEFHIMEGRYAPICATREQPFQSIMISVPENAEAYLASVYTDDWRTPNPNWSEFIDFNRYYPEDHFAKGEFFDGNY